MAPERKTSGHPQRGWNPSNKRRDRGGNSRSKNRTSGRCIKDSRAEGRPCESPEAVKVLFLVHTELKPVLLPLFSGDWRAPPCALTACLCVSRRAINLLPPPSGKGKLGIPFLLSLFSCCCVSRDKVCCNLPAVPSRPRMWFLHGAMENESKWEKGWKSKLSSGEQRTWLGGKVGSGTIMKCPFQRVLFDVFLK